VAIICNHLFNHLYHSHLAAPWTVAYYAWSETFMMPTFAFLSGFLSKGALTPERARRAVATSWAPMVVLHCLDSFGAKLRETTLATLANGHGLVEFSRRCRWAFPNLLGGAPAVAWYLQCWIAWKLLLPFFKAFEGRGDVRGKCRLLAVGVWVSWAGGYWPAAMEGSFHLDTTISLFSMFVLGYVTPYGALVDVGPRARAAAGGVHLACLCAVYALARLTYEPCDTPPSGRPLAVTTLVTWVKTLGRRCYFPPGSGALERMCGAAHDACGWSYFLYWTQRAAHQLAVVVLGGSFVCAMPSAETACSRRGRHSLYAYLLQTVLFLPFVVYADLGLKLALDAVGLPPLPCASALNLFKLALYASLGACAMTSALCRSLTCVIFEPTWLNWLWGEPYSPQPHGRLLLFLGAVQVANGLATSLLRDDLDRYRG
jgi:hypothetical protein